MGSSSCPRTEAVDLRPALSVPTSVSLAVLVGDDRVIAAHDAAVARHSHSLRTGNCNPQAQSIIGEIPSK